MEKVYLTLILDGRKKFSQSPLSLKPGITRLLQYMVDNKQMSSKEMKAILAA